MLSQLMQNHQKNRAQEFSFASPSVTLRIPVKYIGTGEGIDDIQPFNAEEFVDALI